MIKYLTGDLLKSPHKVLLHGCNDHGAMGSGIAKQIRAQFPNVYEIYHLRYKTFGLNLGDIIPVQTLDGKIIVNCITQHGAGHDGRKYVDYDAVEACFLQLNERAIDWEVSEMAMPRIGAGLGGGDWKVISEIIERCSTNFEPIVYDFKID